MPTNEFNDLSKADRQRLKELQVLELAARGYAPPRATTESPTPDTSPRNRFGFPARH
ncbi:hypothetical protein [Micavibrio aeruginosavorus]|uniref:Uncharacterized protein n=1 Tax=Micavibrio aeruginosavorus EPB TaxID=349215 RepID=M4VII7_9BACT|nr:hypothetical protein [Micavibrio aeruginosavorus]AGH97861.1 hypothetical protein A11S_1043 [Micavibrio aeruginosavorus EPB]